MRLPAIAAALGLLWQSPLLVNIGAVARPEYLRFARAVEVPAGGGGLACVALDAEVLAHTASAAHNDLRLFVRVGGAAETEAPYTLTESGPEPVADTGAAVEHVTVEGNRLGFDLRMPPRPYTEVRLRLGLRDFVATATVEGRDRGGRRAALGSVAVFGLEGEGLGRWSSLLLGEQSWPVLHVELAVRTPEGQPRTDLTAAMVEGAEVPPSRSRETRYVPVASTDEVEQRGELSVALLRVAAHVPVERVRFRFAAGFAANFSREVTVSARAQGAPVTDTEALDAGRIEHVSWPSGDARLYPIAVREDAVNATLGATLAAPATVLVAVVNGGLPPLPIRAVELEMRERKLCFLASRGAAYVLRYGDAALSEPGYDERELEPGGAVLEARLGAEVRNPEFRSRHDMRPLLSRHPEIFWLAVLLCGGMMGGTALGYVQQRKA